MPSSQALPSPHESCLAPVAVLRLPKMLLVGRLSALGECADRAMDHWNIKASFYRRRLLKLLVSVTLVVHWVSCVVLLLAEAQGVDNSWARRSVIADAPAFERYVYALYCS